MNASAPPRSLAHKQRALDTRLQKAVMQIERGSVGTPHAITCSDMDDFHLIASMKSESGLRIFPSEFLSK